MEKSPYVSPKLLKLEKTETIARLVMAARSGNTGAGQMLDSLERIHEGSIPEPMPIVMPKKPAHNHGQIPHNGAQKFVASGRK